jgi:hypothetical protein
MDSYTKIIVINSPPGSGGIFCRELLRNNLAAHTVWPLHNLFGFQKDDINICVIRNPYDTLSSGIEAGFLEIPQHIRDFYMDDTDLMISDQLPLHLSNYYRFMNLAQKLDYITPVSFKFLTEDPDGFLHYISKKFKINFLENGLSPEEVKTQILNNQTQSTRVPRDKTELRKKILA